MTRCLAIALLLAACGPAHALDPNTAPRPAAPAELLPIARAMGLTGLTTNVQGTGTPGLDNATWFLWHRPTSATGAFADATLRVDRHAEFQGGTDGNTSSALWALCSAGAGAKSYEWCTKIELDNKATGAPQNVGLNVTTTRHAGSSPTWATNFVCQNRDNERDPTTSCLGSEVDLYVNGTDAHRQRHGFQMVVGKGNPEGPTAHATSALWTTPGADSVFDNIVLASAGRYGTGINLAAGTFTGAGINLGAGQRIALDGNDAGVFARSLRQQDGVTYYSTQHGDVLGLDDSGRMLHAPAGFGSVSECGTGASGRGSDAAFQLSVGGPKQTSCKYVFKRPWAGVPICTANTSVPKINVAIVASDPKTITFGFSGALSNGTVSVHCSL